MIYQVLPALSSDDFDALKRDIKERGVMVPVEYDQDGNIIDGHHRVRACEELGITDWPRTTRQYVDELSRRTQARRLNILRRHLDTAAKRKLIEAELEERPTISDRAIARDLGVSHPTVAAVRKSAPSNGKSFHKDRTEASGRKARGAKPKTEPKAAPPKASKPKLAAVPLPVEAPPAPAPAPAPPPLIDPYDEKINASLSLIQSGLRSLAHDIAEHERAEMFEHIRGMVNQWESVAIDREKVAAA